MASIELPRSLSPEALEAISKWFDENVGKKRNAVVSVLDEKHDLLKTVVSNGPIEKKVIAVAPKPTTRL